MSRLPLSFDWTQPAGGPGGVAHVGVVVDTGGADLDGGTASAMSPDPSAIALARRVAETPGCQWVELWISGLGPCTFELYAQMAGLDFACAAARVTFDGTSTVTGYLGAYDGAGTSWGAVSGTVTVGSATLIPLRLEADADGAHRLIVNGTLVATRTKAITGNYVGFGIRGSGRVYKAVGGAREAPPEPTGPRVARWAALAGWKGPVAIQGGVAGLQESDMSDNAVSALQTLAVSEGLGAVYVAADGTLTFAQRDAARTDPRQNTAQATFTDRDDDPPGACYSDIVPAVDETKVYNRAEVGSAGQPVQRSIDPESLDWFGPRSYRQSLELAEYNDNLSVAILAVYTHADNERRVDQLVLHAGRDEDTMALGARLRLLDRVRLVRHFPGGYVLDQELAVQGVRHRIEATGDRQPRTWQVTYQTSHALPMTDGVTFGQWDTSQWDVGKWSI